MSLLRRSHCTTTTFLRRFCTTTAETSHEYLPRNPFINSWKRPRSPKEAQNQLARLRREHEKQFKQVRKTYFQEMEMQRMEKLRRDEAKKEAQRIANEARRAKIAEEKLARDKQRALAQQDFRKTLLKERAEKLEYWRAREKKVEEKKKAAKELIRRKSSMWIDEPELEKKLLENVVETTTL